MKTHLIAVCEKVSKILHESNGECFSVSVEPLKDGNGVRVINETKDEGRSASERWDFIERPTADPLALADCGNDDDDEDPIPLIGLS